MRLDNASRCPTAPDPQIPTPEEEHFRELKTCSVVTYSEATLLRLPFTGVYEAKERGVTSLALGAEDGPGWDPQRPWAVRSAGLSLPGTYARKVFRALEWMAIEESIVQGRPLTNPIRVSPRELCERLSWYPHQSQLRAIDAAFQALARIEIVDAPSPAANRSLSRSRNGRRLLQIVASGIVGKNVGSIEFSNYKISLDDRFVESVNRGHVVAINWALWIALEDPVAQRLMEVLASESARHPESPVIALHRDTIQRLIPMSPVTTAIARERLLSQAHQALIAAGYVTSVGSPASASPDLLHYQTGIAWQALRLRARKPEVDRYQRMLEGMKTLQPTVSQGARFLGTATARRA